MTVGALLDLGADQDVLRSALDSLHLEGAGIEISRVKKSALDACDFNVVLDAEHENHDHDMAYLHPDLSLSENVQPMSITTKLITIMTMSITTKLITIMTMSIIMKPITIIIMTMAIIITMAAIWRISRRSFVPGT